MRWSPRASTRAGARDRPALHHEVVALDPGRPAEGPHQRRRCPRAGRTPSPAARRRRRTGSAPRPPGRPRPGSAPRPGRGSRTPPRRCPSGREDVLVTEPTSPPTSCSTTSPPIRMSTCRKPIRSGPRWSCSTVTRLPATTAPATTQNAAWEGSPGTSQARGRRTPGRSRTTRPAPTGSTVTSAPASASISSVWARVATGSRTTVSPSASRPASRTALLTWALAIGGV